MHLFYILVFAFFALFACSRQDDAATSASDDTGMEETDDSPSGNPEDAADDIAAREETAIENLAASQEFLRENALAEGVLETESGLQYVIVKEGPEDGTAPGPDDYVVVHYTGSLKDGTEFDSSLSREGPAVFQLGRMIPGWVEGVQLMTEGDRFRFFIPPDLAYGDRGYGSLIAPNEVLVFDVELLGIRNAERNLASSILFLEENARKEGVMTTATGLQYEVVSRSSEDGASPLPQDTVTVHYTGKTPDGVVFDSSHARGEPVSFTLDQVISGWTEGLQLMEEGDTFRFFIPPDLAYGENGYGPIGPNQLLVFDIELIDVPEEEAEESVAEESVSENTSSAGQEEPLTETNPQSLSTTGSDSGESVSTSEEPVSVSQEAAPASEKSAVEPSPDRKDITDGQTLSENPSPVHGNDASGHEDSAGNDGNQNN